MPMMPFMGVRISWLMLARNSLLTRLASSAFSLALVSAAFSAVSSWFFACISRENRSSLLRSASSARFRSARCSASECQCARLSVTSLNAVAIVIASELPTTGTRRVQLPAAISPAAAAMSRSGLLNTTLPATESRNVSAPIQERWKVIRSSVSWVGCQFFSSTIDAEESAVVDTVNR